MSLPLNIRAIPTGRKVVDLSIQRSGPIPICCRPHCSHVLALTSSANRGSGLGLIPSHGGRWRLRLRLCLIGEQIERRQDIWVLDSGRRRDDRSRSVESVALMTVLASGACTPRLSRVLSIVRIVVRLSWDGRVVVAVGHDPCGEDLLGLLVARIEVHVVLVIVL